MKFKLFLFSFFFICSNAKSQLGFKTTVFSSSKPISAKMSFEKDGVKKRDLYIVTYDSEKENGESIKKRVGYLCVEDVGSENSEISNGNSSLTSFKKIGAGKIEVGMRLEKMKTNYVAYSLEYPLTEGSIFSGPNLSFNIRTGYSKLSMFVGYVNKIETSNNISWYGNSKKYQIPGVNIGLKFEHAVPLNYFEIAPIIGFSAVIPFTPLFEPLQPNQSLAPIGSTTGYIVYAFGGLKFAYNVSPRLQLYIQDVYSLKVFENWNSDEGKTLTDQLKNNLNFKPNSINLGIRIR
jgi:hypothetical protein